MKAGLLAAGAIVGAAAIAMARHNKRLKERDGIAHAVGVPVLASIQVLHPTDPTGWRSLLDDYYPEAVDADAGPGRETMRATTATVLGVSAGAATAEQLAKAVAAGESQTIAGILVADPEPTDHTTGRIPNPAAASRHRQPNRMSSNTTQAVPGVG